MREDAEASVILAISILVLLAVAGLAAGWIPSGRITRGQAITTFVACIAAAAVLTGLQYRRASSATVDCPQGHQASHPMTGVITDVKVKAINSVRICVSWLNPDDPDVGGFIISEYPQSPDGNKSPSGGPYPIPMLSSQMIDVTQFVDYLRPEPGEKWRICVAPMGKGIDKNGNYPAFYTRQGCSSTFTWP